MANIINVIVDKHDIGLDNIDNTSDLNKPISTATQTALNGKENTSNKSTNTSLGTSDTLYPSQKAVKTYVDNSITTAPIPTLQQVTTSGSTSNNSITIANATFNNNMTPSQHTVYRSGTNKGVILDADGEVRVNTNGNFTGKFKATNLTADVTCEIPNKTAGSYTIATTDLIGSINGVAGLDGAGKIPIEQIPSSALSILRRHEWTGTYDYIGYAPYGSTESNNVWTITRMIISLSGVVTKGVATGSWTNRASLTYI